MVVTNEQLEKRLVRLERRFEEFEAKEITSEDQNGAKGKAWWHKVKGRLKGDEDYLEAARLGAEIRRQEREEPS